MSLSSKSPAREFSLLESVFAWLCVAAGYAFCRVFPVNQNPFGGFLFILALFITIFVIAKLKGVRFKAMPLIIAVSAVVVSSALIFSANAFLYFFAYIYSLASFCYFIYATFGVPAKNGFSDYIVIDFAKALFFLPFDSLSQIFRAMFTGKARKSGGFILKLLIGAGITIIPTALVIFLLSYDSKFTDLLEKIFDFSTWDVLSHLVSLALAVPIGMYLFSLFISSTDNKCQEFLTIESCKETSQRLKVASSVTVLAAVLPMLTLYVIFFISQWEYYVSAFTGKLPEDFSYAEYAREGFFQLCAVAIINFLVITAILLFMKQKTDKPSIVIKILSVIYSLFTLILISTAIAKMIMYIDVFGLTPKRVYSTWFMIVLMVTFIIVAVRQFVPKLNAVALSLSVCVVLFALLSLSNIDRVIMAYNVNRYINGSLETVDIDAAEELGDAAIPDLVRLAEILDERNGTDIKTEKVSKYDDDLYSKLAIKLREEAKTIKESEKKFFSFTAPSLEAQNALKRIGLI